jgi:hypothetical protein
MDPNDTFLPIETIGLWAPEILIAPVIGIIMLLLFCRFGEQIYKKLSKNQRPPAEPGGWGWPLKGARATTSLNCACPMKSFFFYFIGVICLPCVMLAQWNAKPISSGRSLFPWGEICGLKYNIFAHRIKKYPVLEFIGKGQKRPGTRAVPDPDHLQIKFLQTVDYLWQLAFRGLYQVKPAKDSMDFVAAFQPGNMA